MKFPDFGLGWRAQDGSPVLERARGGPASQRLPRRRHRARVPVPDGRFDVEAAVRDRAGGAFTCRFFPDRSQRDILRLVDDTESARATVRAIAGGDGP